MTTSAEKDHMLMIKGMPCGVCEAPAPSACHHITEGSRRVSHYLTIPLCQDCHQGSHNGLHGQKAMWRVMKMTELKVLAKTIELIKKGL